MPLFPLSPARVAALAAALLAVLVLSGRAEARGGSKKQHHHKPRPLCSGASCKAMSDLLPQLAFGEGFGPKIQCACADFIAGRCFAPGCFPCDKACFTDPAVARLPGPFGTGLLCSNGCTPCCQAPDDAELFEGSTCELPAGGCLV